MATVKVENLTELTAASPTDLVYAVDDPAGTPVGKKLTIGNLMGARKGELYLSVAGGWPSTASGCGTPAQREFATNDVDMYTAAFGATASQYMQWSILMPADWDGGTLSFKSVWTTASGAGSSIIWGLQGRGYIDDHAIDQPWGTAGSVTDNILAVDDVHISPESGAITLAGSPAAGGLVALRQYRDADTDTSTESANLIGVKVYYTRG